MKEFIKKHRCGVENCKNMTKAAGTESIDGRQMPNIKTGMKKTVGHFTREPVTKKISKSLWEMR